MKHKLGTQNYVMGSVLAGSTIFGEEPGKRLISDVFSTTSKRIKFHDIELNH